EYDVLPDHGDPQIVMPKNTSATAAAAAALAEIGSSPTFKAAYPAVASNYLFKAQAGWAFLQRAITKYGRNGCYQAEAYMGNDFMHNDELAWAAAALYAATTNSAYDSDLRTYTPNPNDPSLRLWGWWNMYAGYGCAFRDYAFAARTGRLQASQLNATYLAQCLAEIKTAATNALLWSTENAYGTSFPDENKPILTGAWYFATEKAFDLAVAYQIDPQPAYQDVVLRNFNYELGCNPINITFATGLGSKRQRQIVHQYAENDYRVLPPSGIPLGNIQQGFAWLSLYGPELGELSYPLDGAAVPYPMYDRWGDAWNGITESVVSQQSGRAAGTAAWLMALSTVRTQVWRSATAQISGLPAQVMQNQTVSATVTAPGLDLSSAAVIWEALGQEPTLGAAFNFQPGNIGTNWVEVEAQLPDGRRVFAATNFFALPTNPPPTLAVDADMVALYRLDTNFADATGQQLNLTPANAAALDPIGLRVQALGDNVVVYLPNSAVYTPSKTQAISVEANFYINRFNPVSQGQCYLLELFQTYTTELVLFQQAYQARPDVYGGANIILSGDILTNTLTFNQWHAFNMTINKRGYTVSVDGVQVFSNSSGDLANWLGSGQILLRAGDFDGWIRNLVVRNIQPRQPLITGSTVTNGNFQFGFNAQGSIGYSVLASTNLTNWSRIGGITQSVSAPFQFTDYSASNYPERYYRLRIP
ncbi:MAG TPA: glycoside hydrolase family 9 protein, partial [Bacillota bacterium]|nr:glycoside hydrolase family 9 protein [Bacillota bacterium]